MKYSEAVGLANRTFPDNVVTCRLISNYQFDTFRTFLRAYGAINQIDYALTESGYQNLWNDLFRISEEDSCDFYVVFCTLEDIIPYYGYRSIADWDYAELCRVLDVANDKITDYAVNLIAALSRVKNPVYIVPPFLNPPPLHDNSDPRYDPESSLKVHIHSTLLHQCRGREHIFVVNTERAFGILHDAELRSDKLLFTAGSPYSAKAASSLAKAIHELRTLPLSGKKMVITDLDNTLWRGIIGEDGIGGISSLAEGDTYHHHVYQKFLELLQSEGILLAVCSKNNSADVDALFDHPDLLQEAGVRITKEKFVAMSCSWESKSEQIKRICEKNNLLPSTVVFVDDNPLEIIEVQGSLPDVACIQFPESSRIHELILSLRRYFPTTTMTTEDESRTRLYKLKQETELKSQTYGSQTDFLKDLAMRLQCRIVSAGLSERAFQLINKVNQFNFTGRRFDKDEWDSYILSKDHYAVAGQLFDQFGDHGEIIVALARKQEHTLYIDNLVLSCRVFNRGVETAFLQWLVKRFPDIKEIVGFYNPTGKNAPIESFFLNHSFIKEIYPVDQGRFRNNDLHFESHYITLI